MTRYDAVIIGGGHNGLVAAVLLARAGRTVLVLERRPQLGGAAVNHAPFPGLDASVSRFSYLVSLWPAELSRQLGLRVEILPRSIESYAPSGDTGLLVGPDQRRTRESMGRVTGDPEAFEAWQRFHTMLRRMAERVFPTLIEPLRSRQALRQLIDDEPAWSALFEEPLSEVLERSLGSDLVRGVISTDATIGTFAPIDDPELRQNRCFLYHVIGNGTGSWDVPAGGMGAISTQLGLLARAAGAEIRTSTEVVSLATDGADAEVACADGQRFQGRQILVGAAPEVLRRLMGTREAGAGPEGSQLKVNLVLRRLPRLRDPAVASEEAFTGTFHVNEGYAQLQEAYQQAAQGRVPARPPCDVYCHTLTDPSILSPELRAAGAHTLTVFVLHMPARLFYAAPEASKQEAVAATLRSINSVLAEPIEDCLWRDGDGVPCLEALAPPDLERELGMPGGHIFHRDLSWPFAESEAEVGLWGVETEHPNVWLCGAGARRGGGVSGIPGHNAARAVLASG